MVLVKLSMCELLISMRFISLRFSQSRTRYEIFDNSCPGHRKFSFIDVNQLQYKL